ncbi:MAG: thiamine phosphate synthase [Muribaculum sp.]|nr:thiamine phosphate synthase [Muribaculaceae bacterium]MCM1081553.1 thiamine phosphate synthase [Muribaculum sp.]
MLQFITHINETYNYVSGTEAVVAGGCRWVQLRMKNATEQQLLETGREVGDICRRAGAKFIVDDHVELVEALGADGVHLGKNDMPVAQARKILGQEKIIGATANTFADIVAAAEAGADYIGLGPFRFTTTKQRLSPVLGLEGYATIMNQCRESGINIPVVAIGGITAADIPALMKTGIRGVAVSGTLINAPETEKETRKILQLISL